MPTRRPIGGLQIKGRYFPPRPKRPIREQMLEIIPIEVLILLVYPVIVWSEVKQKVLRSLGRKP